MIKQRSCKRSYQQPEIPEIRGDGAEHLYYGCEQDNILQVPEKEQKKSSHFSSRFDVAYFNITLTPIPTEKNRNTGL